MKYYCNPLDVNSTLNMETKKQFKEPVNFTPRQREYINDLIKRVKEETLAKQPNLGKSMDKSRVERLTEKETSNTTSANVHPKTLNQVCKEFIDWTKQFYY